MRRLYIFFISCMSGIIIFSCKKESVSLTIAPLTVYYPLQVGNSYLYRLDSTVYVSFGTTRKVNSYIAKDSVVGIFSDNLSRASYLVYRYLTDTLQQQPFIFSCSYYITPTKNNIEVTDANNLRYIKLTAPVTPANTWLGNAFIDINPNHLEYMIDWHYQYENINMPYTVAKGTIDSTVTVFHVDIPSSIEPFDPNYYQSSVYSAEVYAKGIGLIYKDFNYWTWQSINSISPGYTDDSYGIRLNLISYTIQ